MSVTQDTPSLQDMAKWPQFMTVPEVSVILRVSKMTVYRMVHHGEIKATRVGRSFKIDAGDLRRFLQDGEIAA